MLLFLVAYRGPAKWRLARLGQENHFHKKGECPTGYEKLRARSTPAVDCRRRCWCRHRLRPDIILTQCHCYPTKARRRNDDNTGEQHTHKALSIAQVLLCVLLFLFGRQNRATKPEFMGVRSAIYSSALAGVGLAANEDVFSCFLNRRRENATTSLARALEEKLSATVCNGRVGAYHGYSAAERCIQRTCPKILVCSTTRKGAHQW